MNSKVIDKLLKGAEIFLALVTITSLFLFYQEVPLTPTILMVSLFTLALFYMASGMYSIPGVDLFNKQVHQDNVNNKLLVIGPFLTGAGYGILMIFILFKILQWDGYETMFLVGIIGSIVGTSILLYAGIGDIKVTLLRFIPILILSLIVYLL